jgi:hypothetical protein
LLTDIDRAVTTMRAGKPYGSMALAMRLNSVPRPDNGQRHDLAGEGRADASSGRRRKTDPVKANRPEGQTGLCIVDDFPQGIPVSGRELDVIETYLGDLLDEALGPGE